MCPRTKRISTSFIRMLCMCCRRRGARRRRRWTRSRSRRITIRISGQSKRVILGLFFEQQLDIFFSAEISVLLAWVLSNSLLAGAITGTNAKAANAGANAAVSGYMTFLLYSVALLACKFLVLLPPFPYERTCANPVVVLQL